MVFWEFLEVFERTLNGCQMILGGVSMVSVWFLQIWSLFPDGVWRFLDGFAMVFIGFFWVLFRPSGIFKGKIL